MSSLVSHVTAQRGEGGATGKHCNLYTTNIMMHFLRETRESLSEENDILKIISLLIFSHPFLDVTAGERLFLIPERYLDHNLQRK